MDGFASANSMLAFEQVATPDGPEVVASGTSTPLGFGLSASGGNVGVTRVNAWLMTGGLIQPRRVLDQQQTIYLGWAGRYRDLVTGISFDPSVPLSRAAFLLEMRRFHELLPADTRGEARWIESRQVSFREKPDLDQDWPGAPPLPGSPPEEPPTKRQIDSGTIGIAVPTLDGPVHVGELHIDHTGDTYREIWVLSVAYNLHMPPGSGTAPRSVVLAHSSLYEPEQDVPAQQFLDSAWEAMGEGATVLLVEASVRTEVPAS